MALKLSLKPGETFILNGAVVRNGERRGVLLLENRARILREKDILQPDEVRSPAARAYLAVMQMYLLGEGEGPAYDEAALALAEVINASDAAGRAAALEVSADVAAGDLYRALGGCRRLMAAAAKGAEA